MPARFIKNVGKDGADTSQPWFPSSVIYQIYPRSFMDLNGDGVGDFKGITSKLDYLNGTPDSLGVTAVWVSPFYPSPMADFGYDVSDYCDVDPLFGTLDDFRIFVEEAHKRDIHVLIDLVPNHSSDEHPWFQESRSSLDNDKRDWYVWKDPLADGSPPNNWLSHFGGSAWELDEITGQMYLHSFLTKQPDLNWDNADVREAMKDIVRFWLDLGVDGFRVDWVVAISKDPEFRDDPPNAKYIDGVGGPHSVLRAKHSENGPNLYDYLNEIAEVLATRQNKFMVTEVYPHKIKKPGAYLKFYERIDPLVCAPLNFAMMFMPWKASKFRNFIDRYQASMEEGYVPIYSTGNHDNDRLVTRFGYDQARTAAVIVMTLPGAPLMYYGDELGMVNVAIAPDQVQDTFEKNLPGQGHGRDPERTPMQWDATANAGFTSPGVTPWLPIADDYAINNAAVQHEDPASMFNLYKSLIALRKNNPSLTLGEYESVDIDSKDVLAYIRTARGGEKNFGVLLNFSSEEIHLKIPKGFRGQITISTHSRDTAHKVGKRFTLAANEGIVITLD